VSVIVVTIGAKDYIFDCLKSLKMQRHSPIETIVIDNSLDPRTRQNISNNFPWVSVYANNKNLFYAASLNKGIELSKGEFILCLNDDVCLDKEFINEALKGFFVDKRIGSISGKILRRDRKTLDSTGLYLSIWRSAKERGYGKNNAGQFEKPGFIFGVSGAAAFYRKEMLDDIRKGREYFDSRLVMFYEDLDLAWRAKTLNWKSYYIPKALAYHVRGGSFRPDSGLGKNIARRYLSDRMHARLIKNRYLVMLKNERIFDFFLHLAPVIVYDVCVWIYIGIFRPKVIKTFFSKIENDNARELKAIYEGLIARCKN
jgi:GT2 family glycosyltransferase